MLHWQEVSQELDGHAIGQERGPSDFLTEQFWCAALREQRGDRTPTALLLRLARAGIQTRAGKRQFAKEGSHTDLVMSLASKRVLAVRALALLLHIVLDLLSSHGLLDTSEHLFCFREP